MLVVNGQFPGPTIYVHKGDTVFVNVHDHGDYGLTIHWHEVKQPRNPWSDGSAYRPGNVLAGPQHCLQAIVSTHIKNCVFRNIEISLARC
ncbi:hypothetical protein V6N12_064843 [Hibiscus sabdariffa]|uniref:Plastocyanin-like domain-containing protein n=1 Tax=Hibiscus sabdariffa TaxID=183260 RepID=A0ABR2G8D4_9ROSI